MTTRQITITVGALGTLGTIATTLTSDASLFHLSPAVATLLGTVGAALYGAARTFQKRKAGASWKSLLATTEAWAMGLPVAVAVVEAAAGIIPAGHAVGLAAGVGIALRGLRVMQAALPGFAKAVDEAQK